MAEQKQKLDDIRLMCGTCGKPIAEKARSNVTRWLFQESRCNCAQPNLNMVVGAEADKPPASDTPPDEAIRNVLGDRYDVISLVGQGGMGAVYKVFDKQVQKTFAVKVLNKNLVEDADSIKRFQQEADAARRLTHPNLIAVYDSGVGTDGSPYLVMDYFEGTNLEALMQQQGTLDVPRALDIFVQVAEALSYAHRQGVIHRDIKPGNIIIARQENGTDFVKVVDFGIAKVLAGEVKTTQNLTQTGEVIGSPLYMSPEQGQGIKLDARTDIYALGCVMYEALTGSPPLKGANPIQTILKHVNEDPAPLTAFDQSKDVPPDLERVVMHCLLKDPDDRYQSADQLLSDLENIRDGRPINIKDKPPRKKKASTNPLRPVTIGLAIACIVLLGAKFAITGFENQSGPTAVVSGDPYTDAERLDQLSYKYFVSGDYERAIPLLEFGIKTYKANGTRMGRYGEDSYLADNLQHIGKCYLGLKQYDKAVPYYRDALAIYKRMGLGNRSMMGEAINDYATVLKNLGKEDIAKAMQIEYRSSFNLRTIP